MKNIQKYIGLLQIFSFMFLGLLFFITLARWLFDLNSIVSWFPSTDLYLKATYIFDSWLSLSLLPSMPFINKFFGLIIDLVGVAIAFSGVIFFNRLMKLLQSKEFFSQNVIKLLHIISKLALSWTIYNPIRNILISLITTIHKGPGNRMISIQIGIGDIINIFIFISFVIITNLIQEGNKIKQEQDLTI